MKHTGILILTISFLLNSGLQIAFADETIAEQVVVKAKDIKRGVKKAAHRTSEALCVDGEVPCAGQKIKNRVIEAKDATKDGTDQMIDKMD